MPSIYSYKLHNIAYYINTVTDCYTYLESSGFIEMTFYKVFINQEKYISKTKINRTSRDNFFSSSAYESNHNTKLASYKNENEILSHK